MGTARATGSALDAMTQETHMTVYKDAHAIPPDATFPENGAFIHGLFIEGARWPFGDEVEEPYEFGGAKVGGFLLESRLKELMPPVPVVYVKAVLVQPSWEPSAVGYLGTSTTSTRRPSSSRPRAARRTCSSRRSRRSCRRTSGRSRARRS